MNRSAAPWSVLGWVTGVLFTVAPSLLRAQTPAPAAGPTGTIGGQVTDRATGQPIPGVRVQLVDRASMVEAGNDGRFRFAGLAPGVYSVRTAIIGYRPAQRDSITVRAGETTTADFALDAAVVELQELTSQSTTASSSKASDAGLLGAQQAAAAASDGISAQAMAKTPDANAGAAITRVTGVTLVDNKFVVIRGLGERYTNTLLNGSELASPEPLKRVVPLDVFPANLLESIVTSKAATPDRPGDFAGGSVEIKTKEFPQEFTAQVNLSQAWNSATTFKPVRRGPRSFSDFFGFDNGSRRMPSVMPTLADNAAPTHGTDQALRAELFGESLRNVWTPASTTAGPNLGFSFNVGNQLGAKGSTPLGYVFSVSYSNRMSAVRDRIYRLAGGAGLSTNSIDNRINEDQALVEWGGIFNLATRLSPTHKLTWKNFYNRSAEETFINGRTFLQDLGGDGRLYQARYIERSTLQTQLAGDHILGGFLGNTRFEWKGSYSQAKRDEPENRSQIYGIGLDGEELASLTGAYNALQFRFLTDNTYVGQTDLSIPFAFRSPSDAVLKFGGLRRSRIRDFDGQRVLMSNFADDDPENFASNLPPEQFWSPEVIGEILTFTNGGIRANSYESSDRLMALYGMVDFPLFPSVRLVGGMRMENWTLDIYYPDRPTFDAGLGDSLLPRKRDYLWSANLTAALGPRTNFRLAGFQTVVRPDPRELTPEAYFSVGGECSEIGDPRIQRTKILNGDIKWEFFPRPNEVISISGYYKDFTTPIINTVGSKSNGCEIRYANAKSATVYGGEIEFRKSLDFLGGSLAPLTLGLNLSLTQSKAQLDPVFSGSAIADSIEPALQAQSPFVINTNLAYDDPAGRFTASVLYNHFGDRIAQYGTSTQFGDNQANIVPDRIEQGRGTLDAKITRRFGRALSLSMSVKNLTNAAVVVTQDTPNFGVIAVNQYRPGVTITLGAGHDF